MSPPTTIYWIDDAWNDFQGSGGTYYATRELAEEELVDLQRHERAQKHHEHQKSLTEYRRKEKEHNALHAAGFREEPYDGFMPSEELPHYNSFYSIQEAELVGGIVLPEVV